MTLYHVHDGDFEIRPNEPKLMIGVHFLKKKTQKQEKNVVVEDSDSLHTC